MLHSAPLSIYPHCKDNTGTTCTLDDVYNRIKSGKNDLDYKTKQARALYQRDKKAYKAYKETEFLAVTFAGTFTQRNAQSLKQHSSMLVLDLDGIPPADIPDILTELEQRPDIVLAFISPSGEGIKIVVTVNPTPTDGPEHKAAYQAALDHFHPFLEEFDISVNVDTSTTDLTRLCFLAHHPQAIYKPEATPIEWDRDAYYAELKQRNAEKESKKAKRISKGNQNTTAKQKAPLLDIDFSQWQDDATVDLHALNYIHPDTPLLLNTDAPTTKKEGYNVWITIGMAIYNEDLPVEIWDAWSQAGDKYSENNPDTPQEKWKSFGGERDKQVTWGTVVKFAKVNGYIPPHTYNPFFTGPRGGFVIESMMQHVQDNFKLVSLSNEKGIRIYENGIFVLDKDATLDKFIMNALEEKHKPRYITDTLEQLDRRFRTSDLEMWTHPEHINLKNGIYNVRTNEFKDHTDEFLSLIQLPVKYDPQATCPEIDTFLSDVLQDNSEDIQLAHEIIGYATLQQLPIPAVFVLLGPTHTGKSTFIDILTALLGIENVSGISLQALDDETMRFARAGLYGKLANMSADLSKRILTGDSNIKKIAAGDRFDVEKKGLDAFSMRPFATLICATNEMPISRDKSDAWQERLIILPFIKQHKGDSAIRNYLDKLTTESELSGLLNHAITGIKRILETGHFTLTENVKEAKLEYELDNNSAARFITENCTEDDGAKLEENSIYPAYEKWCEKERIKTPFTKKSFKETMEKHKFKHRQGRKRDKTRYNYFEGVRWQNTSDNLSEETEDISEDYDPHPDVKF